MPRQVKSVGTLKEARSKNGFSLIELAVVLAIIGILASISYPSYLNQVARSTMTEGRLYLEFLAATQAQSRLENGRFLLLEDLLDSASPSSRMAKSFEVSQKLSPDFLRFRILLVPKAGADLLAPMMLDNWGQFQSDYAW